MKHFRFPLIAAAVALSVIGLIILLQGCDDDRKGAPQQSQQEAISLRESIAAKDQEIVQLRKQLDESEHSRISWFYALCLAGLAAGIAFVVGISVGSGALRAYRKQQEETP